MSNFYYYNKMVFCRQVNWKKYTAIGKGCVVDQNTHHNKWKKLLRNISQELQGESCELESCEGAHVFP